MIVTHGVAAGAGLRHLMRQALAALTYVTTLLFAGLADPVQAQRSRGVNMSQPLFGPAHGRGLLVRPAACSVRDTAHNVHAA